MVTGVPVVVEGLADEVRSAIFVLLGAALLVMAATLALVFRSRLRLLPLALALAAAAMTFGALSLAGGDLTMASIAVLPVLIGLAVDYAIQFQARHDEVRGAEGERSGRRRARRGGGRPDHRHRRAGHRRRLPRAAALAGADGARLRRARWWSASCWRWRARSPPGSPRWCASTAPAGRRRTCRPSFPRVRARARGGRPRWPTRGAGAALARALANGRLGARRARSERALAYAVTRPRRVLAVGLAVAVVGWAVDTQSEVVSDVRELVPQDLQALKDVNTLQEETGVAGEIDVTVRADDITGPEVIAWMTEVPAGARSKAGGYEQGDTCRQTKDPPELCPALSLPDIFRSVERARPAPGERAARRGAGRTSRRAWSRATARPPTWRSASGSSRWRTRRRWSTRSRTASTRPTGVTASVVGLPVLAADANAALSSPLAPRAHAAGGAAGGVPACCWPSGAAAGRPPCR